jgi:hypothetical protein
MLAIRIEKNGRNSLEICINGGRPGMTGIHFKNSLPVPFER